MSAPDPLQTLRSKVLLASVTARLMKYACSLLAPVLMALVAACSSHPDVSNQGTNRNEASVSPPDPAVVHAPPRPFFAVNKIERPLLPASNALGRLAIEGGCIIFISGAGKSLPIWPSGSTLRWDGTSWLVSFNGLSLRVDTDVQLGGGPFSMENRREIRIDGKIPSSCPNSTYAVARS